MKTYALVGREALMRNLCIVEEEYWIPLCSENITLIAGNFDCKDTVTMHRPVKIR